MAQNSFAAPPENLALKATATADSEYSAQYAARFTVDGKVPDPAGRSDGGIGWAVRGATHGDGAELRLKWPAPVTIAEIVYYGRTAGEWNENWRDYAVHLDDNSKPAVKGRLIPGRGPQRIKLAAPAQAARLTIRFLSSYGGSNPGASEVQVYSVSPPASILGQFVSKPPPEAPSAPLPKVAQIPPEALQKYLDGPLAGVKEIVFAVRAPGRDGHWYANFGYYARSVQRKAYGQGGGGLYRLDLRTGKIAAILEDPAGAVRDPQVSYDGRRIVCSYRKAGSDYYHLYEIDADPGAPGGLRQITDGPWDDIEPVYLPDGDILFCSSRCKRWVNCWLTQVAVLYRCKPDGSDLRPVSSNPEHDNTPWPLPDGRILYTRWEYVDRSQVDYHHLWVMNPDGTGQMAYFGNLHPGTVMIDAKPIPGTDRAVVVFSPGHGQREHAGPIYVVDPRGGPDDRPSARRISAGSFKDPYPLSAECFLVAGRDQILLLDAAGATHALYTLPASHRHLEVHEPRPLCGRPVEPVVAPKVDLAAATGRLVLASVTEGRNMTGVRPGEIRKLLVVESLPKPINYTGGMDPLSYGGTFTLERVVGTVPVEPDGSAYLELPALRSFFFVAMDANDMSVKRMQSFLTVQPGETFGCVGCHEQRTRTIMPGNLLATRRPPSRPEPVAAVPDVLDFPRDIQPILDRHCMGCHDYDKHPGRDHGPRAGGVILTSDRGPMFSHSYYTLTVRKQFVDGRNNARSNLPPRSIGTSASPIMAKIAGSHHGVKLDPAEVDRVRYWIESGAAYPGTYAALGTGMIGGYDENRQVLTDYAWPETKAAGEAMARRCDACHKGPTRLPHALSDENGLSFWRPNWNDPRLHRSRHVVFNLTRPGKSLILLAPLSKAAGGYGLCRGEAPPTTPGAAPPGTDGVFASADDADYQAILAVLRRGQAMLDEIKRFDMPGFRPTPQYVREMKRYGVLPETFDLDRDPIDVYRIDQAYWQSLWHHPPAAN